MDVRGIPELPWKDFHDGWRRGMGTRQGRVRRRVRVAERHGRFAALVLLAYECEVAAACGQAALPVG